MPIESVKTMEPDHTAASTVTEDLRTVVHNFLTPMKVLLSAAVYAGHQLAQSARENKTPEVTTKKTAS